MRVIENSKKSKNFNLKEFNNFENKTTEFFNFICELCRKYNMKIYKVVKTYSNDKNMGVQLNSINGHANIFYNYNKNDKVVDEFGNTCILNEDIELGKISKRINVTRVKDGKTYFIYGSSIVPCIDE